MFTLGKTGGFKRALGCQKIEVVRDQSQPPAGAPNRGGAAQQRRLHGGGHTAYRGCMYIYTSETGWNFEMLEVMN